ncbi:iron ABC transporter permease [Cohnella sp. LGH]|uniref:Iron complex transport system permease protein n=1 Tax=Cohnella phaseoli TaxID=456490 RepID=A0A3D9HVR2_9BACL|nr:MULTISPECIES: iron ABC transporter permease [Cohnella]QTH43309.1 iron ABC transporter permease [Cohnella sp. LGH]RED52996.1 iron complex transport system permease protein [Cohnella phaseoli]
MKFKATLPALLLALSPVAIIIALVLSVIYGSKAIPFDTIRDALLNFDPDNVDHQIVRHSRLPRAAGSFLIGAFLAVSGALMQGMTRNYLASPSILGISDGSVFAITLCMIIAPNSSMLAMIFYSLLGSAFSVIVVFGLAASIFSRLSPVSLAILGTVIGTFLSSVSAAMATYFQVSQNISFWYNARLHQLDPDMIKLAIPFAVAGLLIAMLVAKSVTMLSLGEDVSTGLGVKTAAIKLATMASVVLLTGIAVALAGKIGFVGLLVPHIVRMIARVVDYRWIVPLSAAFGGLFLTLCDLGSRFLNYPFEMPVGVVTAIFGVPFFLYLIRTKGGGMRESKS